MLNKVIMQFFSKEAERINREKQSDREKRSKLKRNLAIGSGLLLSGLGARKFLRKAPAAPKPMRAAISTVKEAPSVKPKVVDYWNHMRRVAKDMGLDEDEFYDIVEDRDQIYDGDMLAHYYDLPDYLKNKGIDPTDFVNRFVPSFNKHFPDSHQLEAFTSPIDSKYNLDIMYNVGGGDPLGTTFVSENVHPGIRRVANSFPFFPEGVNTRTR